MGDLRPLPQRSGLSLSAERAGRHEVDEGQGSIGNEKKKWGASVCQDPVCSDAKASGRLHGSNSVGRQKPREVSFFCAS